MLAAMYIYIDKRIRNSLIHKLLVSEGYEIGLMGADERHGIWCCLQELILIINVTCIYGKES